MTSAPIRHSGGGSNEKSGKDRGLLPSLRSQDLARELEDEDARNPVGDVQLVAYDLEAGGGKE